ncbi:hypothetical protein MASR2M64_08650 [Candidatus Cloacimonadota bacterium]
MRTLVSILVLSLISLFMLAGCGKEEETPPPIQNLISMATLYDDTVDWLFVLGGSEDSDGTTTTDSYYFRYNGTETPQNVQLFIDDVAHSLTTGTRTRNYRFSESPSPVFNAGQLYALKLVVDDVTKAECNIRMADAPLISSPTGFNSTQDYNFQWLVTNNAMVQYVIGELPSNVQTLMATLSPELRQYTYTANTLATESGWYEFGIVNANYKVVNNIRFCTMFAGWTSVQQAK